ncbi:MAG TPA: hypothetical protein DCP92_01320 [Nitrospiraceae bacterium]|jgi:hypothetical protein|nr:hypothetical protein [Nitrospiraceae bacterium]
MDLNTQRELRRLSSEDEITVFHAIYWVPSIYPCRVWFSRKWNDKEYDAVSYCNALKEIKKKIGPGIGGLSYAFK